MPELVKHPLVDCDVEEAALWYHRRDPRVAERFIDAARQSMRHAVAAPSLYMETYPGIRRVRLKGFPQSAYYFATDDVVYILTVAHGARSLATLLRDRIPSDT